MKYFVITVDKSFVPPVPIGWYGKIDRKSWKGKKAHEMPKHLLFQAEPHMQMVFTDIMTFPCFMVVIMRMDLVESILRRDAVGVGIEEVEIIEGAS